MPPRSADTLHAMSLESLLRKHHLKATRPRVSILRAMLQQPGSIAPELLFQKMAREQRHSLSSIYRVLSDLHRADILIRHDVKATKIAYSVRLSVRMANRPQP